MFDYMNPTLVNKKLSLKRIKTDFSAWFNYQKLKNKSMGEIIDILHKQKPDVRIKLLLQKDIRDKIYFSNNFFKYLIDLSSDERKSIIANLSRDEILKGLYSGNLKFDLDDVDPKVWISKLSLDDIITLLKDPNIFKKYRYHGYFGNLLSNLSNKDKLAIMNNPNILNNLDSISLGNLVSKLNFKSEDIVDLMNNQLLISKLNLSEMLSKLSIQELVKALKNPEITANLGKNGLISLLSLFSIDNLKVVVNNLDIVSILGADGLANLASNISSDIIIEAIKNSYGNDWNFFVDLLSKKTLQQHIPTDFLKDIPLYGLHDLTELLLKMPSNFKIEALNNSIVVSKMLSYSDVLEIISKLQPNQILEILNNPVILDKVGLTDMLSLLPVNDPDIFFKAIKKVAGEEKYDYVIKNKDYVKNIITKTGSCSIISEMNFDLFKDNIISSLSPRVFEKLCLYKEVSEIVVDLFNSSNDLGKYFGSMLNVVQNQNYTANMNFDLFTLKFIHSLRDKKSNIFEFVNIVDVNNLSEDDFKKLSAVALSNKGNISVSLKSKEDLNTYEERFEKKCDEIFISEIDKNNIDGALNAYFNRYYGMSLDNTKKLLRSYGYSLDNLDLSDENNKKNYDYLMGIKKILEVQDVSTLKEIYDNSEAWSFEERLSFEQAIPQMYAKDISKSLYKLDGRSPKEAVKYELDGKFYEIPVYEPEVKNDRYDFKMLIHSTNAYGSMELKNDSYYESWNNSDRVRNHGICCGFISNSYMGFPPIRGNGVILGFDSFSEKSLSASGPYDLGTRNDDYEINACGDDMYMTADDMINASRDTHNEQTIERRELRDDMTESKLQPSYVIITDDMNEEFKSNAYKCAVQMNIPVVYLDKKKIGEKESEYINKRIEELGNTQNERVEILKDILTVHENNRAGERIFNDEEREKLFPTSRIVGVFASEVKRAILQYSSGDMIDFSKSSMEIMSILDSEMEKFSFIIGFKKKKIDFNAKEYENSLMKLIPECGGDKDKFREMASDFAKRQEEEILKVQEDVNVQEKGRQL